MTNQDWKDAESALSGLIGHVKFEIDGYTVSVRKELIKSTALVYAPYVNGQLMGAWFVSTPISEEARRFYWTKTKPLHTANFIAIMLKYDKQEGKRLQAMTYSSTLPYFKSFATLKKSFLANNNSIKLIKSNIHDEY